MDNRSTIVFRADGNSVIGLGHVIRCLALCEILSFDFFIKFAIQNPSATIYNMLQEKVNDVVSLPETIDYEEDRVNFMALLAPHYIVVLDGYHFNETYQKAIKSACSKLIYIDDLVQGYQYADVIINHNDFVKPNNYKTESYTKLFIGSNYALLRKAFLQKCGEIRLIPNIEKLTICFGGADPLNLTTKVLNACLLTPLKEIHVVIGNANNHYETILQLVNQNQNFYIHENLSAEAMVKLMSETDLIVCPSSTIVYEALCLDLNVITGYYAENQKLFLQYLENNNYVYNVGDWTKLDVNDIYKYLVLFIRSYKVSYKKKLIKENSAANLLNLFLNINN